MYTSSSYDGRRDEPEQEGVGGRTRRGLGVVEECNSCAIEEQLGGLVH